MNSIITPISSAKTSKTQQAATARLNNKASVNAFRKAAFAKRAELTKGIRINMAIRQIRLSLQRRAMQPDSLFLTLCTHPYFPLVFRLHPKRQGMESLAFRALEKHGTTPQLRSLAQALSAALPDLEATFETVLDPQQVWLSAAQQLVESPLGGNPLAHLSAAQLFQFSVIEHPTLDTKPLFAALTVQQRTAFLRCNRMSWSWSILFVGLRDIGQRLLRVFKS